MSTDTAVPETGQIVAVRQRLYLVDHVIPAPNASDSLLVRLSCVDDDARGQPLDVLWNHELDAEIRSGEAWDSIAKRGFDPADRFAAYLNTLRWNCVTSTDPNLLQSPFRAGIRLDAYQLEPVWSKISNALKRLGFRSHNFLVHLLSETSTACTLRV
jgi:hypothetical protein